MTVGHNSRNTCKHMAKTSSFKIIGDITNAESITEVAYNYSFKGKTLSQGIVDQDGGFEISFSSKKKAVNGTISFEDLNGVNGINFSIGTQNYSLSDNESTAFKANSKKNPQIFNYQFSLNNPEPSPAPDVNRISLSTFQDIYSATQGGQVISGTFTPNNARLSAGQNIVLAAVGTLGQQDTLTDTTSGDNDQLQVSTSGNSSLQNALENTGSISGIENFVANASRDTSARASFSRFEGLETISISGSFTARLLIQDAFTAGARTFDFSDLTGIGASLLGVNSNGVVEFTNDPITITGSSGADFLNASIGTATIRGGSGEDVIQGSRQSSGFYAGELNNDFIDLLATTAQETVSLVGITSAANGDTITGFTGALNVANGFDLLQFDTASFSNYTAGATINLIDRQEAINRRGNAAALQNTVFFVNNAQDLNLVNLQNGKGSLAIVLGTDQLVYSANGDFTNNRYQAIASINNTANLTGSNFSII